ncbi:VOC family protein [Altibacter sp.]|uniref:VOC family protein n=1 Tax=Altibacter sp. TaxID=2024823 RepID=UPI000C930A71|nr:VOC family protein [Altibacter sp.]MAP53495.1 glyoxalase [Altibacter sp.]
MEHNMFAWIEIPVSDMARAQKFYEAVFKIDIELVNFDGFEMGWFPFDKDARGAAGTLVKQESYIPSTEGPLVYFFSTDVQKELDRVEAAGGKIYQEKTQISEEHGYMAAFIDSEGNRVALHSQK